MSVIFRIFICISLLAFLGCENTFEDGIDCETVLFGNPSSHTGLNNGQCRSQCSCKNYIAKDFTSDEINGMKSWVLLNPMDLLIQDPYEEVEPSANEGVCAFIVDDAEMKTYRLESFPNKESAIQAGAILTHYGPCGLCSTLQDLAVYVENPDLGTFTRRCAFLNFNNPVDELISCLMSKGFTKPCAQIWSFNAKHTQAACLDVCIDDVLSEIFNEEIIPYNNPDGSLSECILCDEILSGPIFKFYSGRTRRNSGLPSAICRSCDEVRSVSHDYPL